MVEVAVPFSNTGVWRKSASWMWYGYSPTEEFSEWVRDMGWEKSFWYDNTSKSTETHHVLIFKEMKQLLIFKLRWGGA